jgi:ABC-type uncharacterized transport system substrate-binding protein
MRRREFSTLVGGAGAIWPLAARAADAASDCGETRDYKNPIVTATARDPVRLGVVASYARPGGNITGVTLC